jgi:dipeptidyl aminopeptidase/acylaminoacyl peptidase
VYVMSADGEREALREVTPQGFGGQNPVWTPDGQALLFIAAKDTHFYSRGIYKVPAAGGEPVRITPADDARNNWPSFSPDGQRVAYISDRGGYLNIWTMAADGSDQRQLTNLPEDQDYPENDYIQSIGLRWSPDGRRILHFTNRHGNFVLITVDTRSGAVKELAAEPGQHHPVGWLSNDTVAYVRESHDTPPDLHVRALNGKPRQLTHSAYAAMQPAHMGGMEPVSWESEGGVTVHGFLRKPSWAKPGDKLPGIVFSHTYNVGQSYNQWVPIFSYLVESGYVILMVNHRGSNGYGTAFRDLPRGNWGFAQLQDIESGAALLRATPGVDPERVGMLGYSMGGYLTQLAMTARPGLFKTGVAVFGLGQITGDPERSHQNYVWHLGGTEAEIPDAFNNASPVTHVPKMQSPIMLVHSDGDPIEPVSKVHNFTQAMDKHGKAYEARIYTNEAHGLRLLEHQRDSYERILNFLKQHL